MQMAYRLDGSRPTLANMFSFGDLLSNTIDVQGFSHQSRTKLERCHDKLPNKPILMSECCSCNTMRDEDDGCETELDNPHHLCTQVAFNARCAESNGGTNASDGVEWAVGTMVWTLFDYYGEPPVGGPEVSSTYGQYDLCGFPKASAFWYRTQWLLTAPDGADKTFATQGKHEVHIVESWEPPSAFDNGGGGPTSRRRTSRMVHAYSSAPRVELLVNGQSQGSRGVVTMRQGPGSYAEWLEVPFEAGNLTAVATDAAGAVVATAARHTNTRKAALQLSIDAPHPSTGTGSRLLLDGQDAALLRATVLDANGRQMMRAIDTVTFRVLSGPGRVQGTHNGDPHARVPNSSPWHPAYHGLVRAVVRVTSVAARSSAERAALARIDVHGPMSAGEQAEQVEQATSATEPIVVEASAPGLAPARVAIAVSTDAEANDILAVAVAAAGKQVDFFATAAPR
jgi:hypothetical protein